MTKLPFDSRMHISTKPRKSSVPQPGSSIWATASLWSEPLLNSVTEFLAFMRAKGKEGELLDAYHRTYAPPINLVPAAKRSDSDIELCASVLFSIWLIHQRIIQPAIASSLRDAEVWFAGGKPSSQLLSDSIPDLPADILKDFKNVKFGADFDDLFPYIIEVLQTRKLYEPRKPSAFKRRYGIFYTPSDVADYLVAQALSPWRNGNAPSDMKPLCLDPACGTGVILRSVLEWFLADSEYRQQKSALESLKERLYGFDISEQAVLSCAFTLLLRSLGDVNQSRISLLKAWREILRNLVVIDSTRVDGSSHVQKNEPSVGANQTIELRDVIPDIGDGFTVIVANPPYSKVASNFRQQTLNDNLQSVEVSPQNEDAYPLFFRLLWKLANPRYSTGSMIVPMSIAYHSGKTYGQLRREIMNHGGNWRFSFFDRTPDSIFGDAIKVRTAVVTTELNKRSRFCIESGPLMRWNIQKRGDLFKSIPSVSLGSFNIAELIPKVGTKAEFDTYKVLLDPARSRLGTLFTQPSKTCYGKGRSTIYFRVTAYNWLPLFRDLPKTSNELRKNMVAGIRDINSVSFFNPIDTDFAFAVASSRIAYWLWRVTGDGFHLTRKFLANLPFHPSAYLDGDLARLRELGISYWELLKKNPIAKVNAGVLSISYSPHGSGPLLDEIDRVLMGPFDVDSEFLQAVKSLIAQTIIAGRRAYTRVAYAREHL